MSSTMWEEVQKNNLRISKWKNYFPIYDRYFAPWRGKKVKMLEIGVQQGGSLELWKRYLGDEAQVVGIDHEPRFAFEAPGITVRTGEAHDEAFLAKIMQEFYPFDIIVDDGSKIDAQVLTSFKYLYPHLTPNGFYIMEDTYMHFLPGTAENPGIGGDMGHPPVLDYAYECAKELTKYQSARWSGWNMGVAPTFHTRNTKCISFYDSMVVFERGSIEIPNTQFEYGALRAAP